MGQTQPQQLPPNDSAAGTAALMAQQRRAVAEMAALEEQRQAQLMQQQLQIQQQLQQEQLQQLRQESLAAQAQSVAGHSKPRQPRIMWGLIRTPTILSAESRDR